LVGAAGGFSWSDEDEELSSPLMAFLDKAVFGIAGDGKQTIPKIGRGKIMTLALCVKVWNSHGCS